jgi:hypothetical protein
MIMPMRRESSTVVSVVGEVRDALLAELARSPNLAVVRPPGDTGNAGEDDGIETAVRALRQATGKGSSYVLVPADPLAAVASQWRAMWDLSQGPRGSAGFEASAAEAVAAWRAGRFELPDYYLMLAPAAAETPGTSEHGQAGRPGGASAGPEGTGPDLYLGPLRAVRPRRVAVALAPPAQQQGPLRVAPVLDALRGLQHGPWWPPLDELIDAARRFFPGALGESPGSAATAAADGP